VAAKPLRIAKARRQVSMWVHPEGLVKGAIFVTVGQDNQTQEDPRYVLNADKPFLVLQRENPEEVRFYNRTSIVRVEYEGEKPNDENATTIPCRLNLMDGSMLEGDIIEVLPADHSRLYDYLNQGQERFIRLFTDDSQVCMVNKNYIIQVTTTKDKATKV
jgi:hypothetical protein